MDEEALRAVAGVIEADNNIRTSIINNLISCGKGGLEEVSYQIARRLTNRYGINLGVKTIAGVLFQPFEWGMARYMADYDQRPLEQDSLINNDGNIDENSVDHVRMRTKHVGVMLEALDCQGNNQNYYWQDFAGRGYNAIRGKIAYEFGENAAKKFDYYEWGSVREDLNIGIRVTLSRAHNASIGEVEYLQHTTRNLEGIVDANRQNRQSEISINASLFR